MVGDALGCLDVGEAVVGTSTGLAEGRYVGL